MHKVTQEKFDSIKPATNGDKFYPQGDYSGVAVGGNYLVFPGGCIFPDDTVFGKSCVFGNGCKFGVRCLFGSYCCFVENCSFDRLCEFGNYCEIGPGCTFGRRSKFGEDCKFANRCVFEGGHLANPGFPYLAIDGAGDENRKTYFWNFTDGIHVRAGCFFGTLAEFKAKVKEDASEDTAKYIMYMSFAEAVEKVWKTGKAST